MECPSRMISDPGEDLGVFVGGVIVGDGMDDLSGGDRSFDRGVLTAKTILARPWAPRNSISQPAI